MSRVVLVHGFSQVGASWARIAEALRADGHEVVCPDVDPAPLPASGDAVAALGPATFVGYSMGGRIALHAALRHPQQVEALVLLGATAGIDDPDERAARRSADEALAERVELIGADAFLGEWLAQPLFAGVTEPGPRDTDAARLAASLRLAGTGTQEPLWDRLPELAVPVLVVAGEQDAKFRALGERLAAGIGAPARLALVPGAGHAAHLERPDAFLDVLRPFLAGH